MDPLRINETLKAIDSRLRSLGELQSEIKSFGANDDRLITALMLIRDSLTDLTTLVRYTIDSQEMGGN